MHDLRVLTWAPVALMVTLLLASVVEPAATADVAVLLAVAGAAFGIPHGAVDHLVPWWWAGTAPPVGKAGAPEGAGPSQTRRMAVFAAGYAAAAVAALGAFLIAPTPTLLVFLLLAAAHFGRGEVVAAAERAGRPVPGASTDWVVAAAHGLVVVGLLFWARPASTDPFLRPLSGWLAGAAVSSRPTGLVLVSCSTVLATGFLLLRRRHIEAFELVLLTAVFSVAPPLAAFGVYFGGWHAVRHTGRLLDLARDRAADRGRPTEAEWWAAVAVLARAAVGPSVVALAAVAALWALRDLAGLQAQVGVLLALTFPHSVVVWQMDRRQGTPAHHAAG